MKKQSKKSPKPTYEELKRENLRLKRTVAELKADSEKYQAIYDHNLNCIYIHDLAGNFLDANEGALSLTGYSREEIQRLNLSSLIDSDQLSVASAAIKEIEKTGFQKGFTEYKLKKKDGTHIWVETDSTLLYRQGKPFAIQGVARDITLRKEAETALLVSERNYRELVQSANSLILRLDPKGKVKFINEFAKQFFGYTEKEIIGRNVVGTIVPKTESSGRDLATMIKDLGHHPERYISNENENIRKNGQCVWIAWTNKGIQDETGKTSEILCVGNDITGRKEAEKALVEREAQLRTVIESLPFDFFALDENGRYVMQNATCKKHWGDIIGQRPKDIGVDKDILAQWEENNRRAYAGETVEGEVVLRPGGDKRFYHNIISPVRDNDRIRGILGVDIDITERKQAEKALRESEEKFRSVAEQSPNMIFINKKGKVVYCNKKCEELMGYSQEEFCSLEFDFLDLISEESKKTVKSAFTKHMKGQEIEPYEYHLVTKSGDTLDAIITTKLIQYDGDRAILGIVTDITKRKKMEEALSESEAKFRALAESAPAAIIMTAGEKLLYVNPAFESISGFTEEEALTMKFWELVHPNMQNLVKERGMARQRGEAVPNRYEIKTLTKDGQERWIDLAATSIEYGGQIATLATAYDITESKQAKDSLLAREQELKNKTHDLAEMNTALRVLLKKRDDDKIELEEKIQLNVKQLILPYLNDLKNTKLTSRQATLLGILKTNFNEIISPFANKLTFQYKKLTPKEIQVADLIKHGKTTKEIGISLNLSPQTIESHRKSIRFKLGIKKAKANLRTHLLSLA